MSACFCTGPQNGEPLCPCNMKTLGVIRRDNFWVIPEKIVGIIEEGFTRNCCSKCGLDLKPVMGYVCPRTDCPCGLGTFSN